MRLQFIRCAQTAEIDGRGSGMGAKGSVQTQKTLAARIAFIVAAAAIVVCGMVLPTPDGLTYAGKMSIALLLAGLVLWVAEPVPLFISGLAIMILLPCSGVSPFLNATDPSTGATTIGIWGNFISNVIFFILASFGITAALLKTRIPKKLVFTLLKAARGSSRGVVGAFMLVAAVISLFISDLPCIALLTGIAVSSILELQGLEPGKSNLGKALMIGITYAGVVGGQGIPSGSAMNIMAMGMLQAQAGIQISFLGWSIICMPIAAILLVVCWLSVTTVFKLEPIDQAILDHIQEEYEQSGKLDAFDWKVIAIIGLAFCLWVASNWTGWDITAISILCLVLFFLPGVDVLTMPEYMRSVSWNVVILIGCVQSIASGVKDTGAAKWLFSSTLGNAALAGAPMVALVAALLPLLKILIPVGPAFIAICLIPLTGMAPALGVSPVVFAVMIGVNASTTFIMGVDSANLLSYRYRYWTLVDFFKAGILPTIAMIALHATILLPLVGLAGY